MGVPAVKAALDLLGLRGGPPRPPLASVPDSQIEEIRSILATAEVLTAVAV